MATASGRSHRSSYGGSYVEFVERTGSEAAGVHQLRCGVGVILPQHCENSLQGPDVHSPGGA